MVGENNSLDMKIKLILFDWNGTILDDMLIWWEAVSRTFRAFDTQPPTIDEYFQQLQGDYLAMYTSRGITASREALNIIYEKAYEELVENADLFPKAAWTLLSLRQAGVELGLITMQKEELVRPLLKKFAIEKFFTPELCRFHSLNKKDAIEEVLALRDISKSECLFVGDTPSDAKHGRAAGVKTATFLTGHLSEHLFPPGSSDRWFKYDFYKVLLFIS